MFSPHGTMIRRPPWLDKRIDRQACAAVERLLTDLNLATVCQQALCPNIGECFARNTATFLILGRTCTRGCRFCGIRSAPVGDPDDAGEPARVAEAVARLGVRHIVVTSVTRDDLPDGGAVRFAETVRAIRARSPGVVVEVLVPDFSGSVVAADIVLAARPDIFGHNVETVPRLYPAVRTGADYRRSLGLLRHAADAVPHLPVKSGIMVGLGETVDEVRAVMDDLRAAGCTFLSIGQYLAPARSKIPVIEYVTPEQFDRYHAEGLARGFAYVAAGPYVRSSYLADRYRTPDRTTPEKASS